MRGQSIRFIVTAFSCVLLFSFLSSGQSQNFLKNPNFEVVVKNEPASWETNNIPPILTVVSISPKAKSGKNSLKLEVKDFHGTKIGGAAIQGDISIPNAPLRLSGYALLNLKGGDQGMVALCLETSSGSTVGLKDTALTGSSTEFKPFSLKLAPPAAGPEVTKARVRLAILGNPETDELHEGSSILFDDLALETVTTQTPEK
ncbi:MAG: hypothetical protein ACPL4I_05605 [Bacteroidota bacterium]